jgi:hypothetical protein
MGSILYSLLVGIVVIEGVLLTAAFFYCLWELLKDPVRLSFGWSKIFLRGVFLG